MEEREPVKRVEISNEIRNLVIKFVIHEGKKKRETAKILNITESSVRKIIKKYNETGIVTVTKKGGLKPTGLTSDVENRIRNLMEDNKIYILKEIKELIETDVCLTTVWRWLKKLNYTYKLVRRIPETRNCQEVKNERVSYVNWYLTIQIHRRYRNLIFIDESPFNLHIIRAHGFSKKGTTPNLITKPSKGPNVSMILAINCQNIIHSEAIIGSGVDKETFKAFLVKIKDILGDEEDFTIVMDNVPFHHSNQDFLDTYPYEIKYLPRYSPFLNPCEETFSKIKNAVRGPTAPMGTNDLLERMRAGCESITENNLSQYFHHCESSIGKIHLLQDIDRN